MVQEGGCGKVRSRVTDCRTEEADRIPGAHGMEPGKMAGLFEKGSESGRWVREEGRQPVWVPLRAPGGFKFNRNSPHGWESGDVPPWTCQDGQKPGL